MHGLDGGGGRAYRAVQLGAVQGQGLHPVEPEPLSRQESMEGPHQVRRGSSTLQDPAESLRRRQGREGVSRHSAPQPLGGLALCLSLHDESPPRREAARPGPQRLGDGERVPGETGLNQEQGRLVGRKPLDPE